MLQVSLSGDSDGSLPEKLSSKKRKKTNSVYKKDSSNESEADETSTITSELLYDSTNDGDSTNSTNK